MDPNKLTWSAFAISAIAFTASMAGVAGSRDLLKTQNTAGDALTGDDGSGGLLAAASQCPVDSRGNRFGGNKAECNFPCKDIDYIFVQVGSADKDAGVSGRGECGQGVAACSGQTHCVGKSRGLSGRTTTGVCKGSTSENWASPMTLDCWGEPSGTCSIVCMETEEAPADEGSW